MEQNIFKTKRAFLVPFIAIVALLCLLLILSLFKGQSVEKIVLAISFFGTLLVGIEASKREIIVTKDGLKIKKFFRTKDFIWPEITHLGVVDLRNKTYFLLTTTKGFYFFSNMFENHALLIRSIVDKLGDEKVEIEVKNYLDHPSERRSLIVICWVIVLIISAFIILKLFSA
ncbi:MAG: hypothetical protein CVU55_06500 [Deltaproteobacteria bacterium HGW-Deltaproteobacteria-13]|jgi:lysylphosphatidylglycerol synthetase-like protein (DUF2156 family)|nr:MAG: hypothetical protein CVU55_06500 [Deltaproteobacteria bacterium HGW-Deltaproteobacteria-13]